MEPEVLAVTAAVVHGQRGMITVGMGKNRDVWWKLSAMRIFSKPPVMDRLMWQSYLPILSLYHINLRYARFFEEKRAKSISELGSFLSLMTLREGALELVSDHRAALSRLTTRAAAEAMRAIRNALSLLLRICARTTEPMLTRAAITPTAI